MRRFLVISVLMVVLTAGVSGHSAWASSHAAPPAGPAGPAIVAQQRVDDNDDTRVSVQLVVTGIVAIVVVGVGTAAFAVRWKLGRTKYDRAAAEAALGHH